MLNNVAAALMDTSMMRQVVDGDVERRKALGEDLRSLQRRLKQCGAPLPHRPAYCLRPCLTLAAFQQPIRCCVPCHPVGLLPGFT